jgi:hypothetical protein
MPTRNHDDSQVRSPVPDVPLVRAYALSEGNAPQPAARLGSRTGVFSRGGLSVQPEPAGRSARPAGQVRAKASHPLPLAKAGAP